MPHFIVEYSDNLHEQLDFQSLFKSLHEYVVSTGAFPLGGVRSRAIRCYDYRVADGRDDFSFLNLNLKIGHGRDMALKQEVANKVFEILCDWMTPITDSRYCQISFEMTELDPVLKFNKNNIHPLFAKKE
ncbi:5-carboxymethyl-2-hydroxymuconate Delta-isomerase [Oceanospirillum maris]|jgi:5-carboxymethyl-2-hydroxymuconate isomerase|uniref:5-carboxymethyl-2-hydroxymuconate Delta-isomerase n=1 Tax=Oceanospirillum maris TaxID=64977 RepID=UPI0003FFBF51|nr:5-carboxymethyl-2-hydroxymuconate Delta-isomerase [Oceanospirillum maris]